MDDNCVLEFLNHTTNLFNEPLNCSNHALVVILTKYFCSVLKYSVLRGNEMGISLPSIMTLALLPGLTRTGNRTAIYAHADHL